VATDGAACAFRDPFVEICLEQTAWCLALQGQLSTPRSTHRLKQDPVPAEELQRIMRSMLNGISYFFRPF
jgi:hypothetical protein